MTLTFRKAERRKAKLRLGLCGTAGSGKTYSALVLAKGLGEKTAFIDTEAGSGDLYANEFDYDILRISAPFSPERYIEAIKSAEDAGYGTIIVDSLTHAWSGEGGVLDRHGKWTDKEKGNSYVAWRHVTPEHNALIEAMLQSKCHVIATMRSKTEYDIVTNDQGRKMPVKIGLAPVQREGMDFEFTVVLDVDSDHNAKASKDRTRLFADPLPFRITDKTGQSLKEWLESGKLECENCLKKNIVSEATEEADGMRLCQPCADRWKSINQPAIKPEEPKQ